MKLSELAKYCEEIGINCDICIHNEKCERLAYELEDISPIGVIGIVKEDKELI